MLTEIVAFPTKISSVQVGTARRAVRAASSGATDRRPDASARRPYLTCALTTHTD